MKITLKVSKRIRFYTMMIACSAFLWMMVRNHWINLDTLSGYAFLVIIVIALMVLAAALTAWCIRKIAALLSNPSSKADVNHAKPAHPPSQNKHTEQ